MKLSKKVLGLLALLMGSASLQAQSDDPFGNFNFRQYTQNVVITVEVLQNGDVVTDAVVAVYCGDELRGKERVGTGTNPNLAFVSVYGDYTGNKQHIDFKVFARDTVFVCTPGLDIKFTEDFIASNSDPFILTLPVSLADKVDNSSVLTTFDSQTCDVVLTGRTLYKDGKWNTLCLPFSLTTEQIAAHANFADAKLMELNTDGKNGFDATDGTLYLSFKKATEITAGVPYLVKWCEDGDDFTSPVFCGVTIDATATTKVSDADTDLQEVQMVGCYSPVPVVADDKSILFLGDANTLYYSTVDRDIHSCRAYFSVPYIKQNVGVQVRAFRLDFGEDELTGIITVHGEGFFAGQSGRAERMMNSSEAWYTLDGRRLAGKPTKSGMYIRSTSSRLQGKNGEKLVVIK